MDNTIDEMILESASLLEKIEQSNGDLPTLAKEYDKLEERFEKKLLHFDHSLEGFDKSLLAGFCADSCALYAGLFITSNSTDPYEVYCGEDLVHQKVARYSKNSTFTSSLKRDTLLVDESELSIISTKAEVRGFSLLFCVAYDSPFFKLEDFSRFHSNFLRLFDSLFIKSYDVFTDNKGLQNWIMHYQEDLYLFYYHFSNFYSIFNHLGIDMVEKINEYILARLNTKNSSNILIYQHTMEKILVFFKSSAEDKRTLFNFNEIPIPYVMKKLLLRGGNKYKKLMDFITEQ